MTKLVATLIASMFAVGAYAADATATAKSGETAAKPAAAASKASVQEKATKKEHKHDAKAPAAAASK
jgi:hypothetical protein